MADGYDETKLRNKIALGLATELGMPYTPEGRSVDLYCNGEYYGIYLLCEKIEVGKGRVDITDMEANSSLVYTEAEKENLETVVSSDGSRKWTAQEVEEADLSGGYLFERELPDRYSKEVSGFVTTQGDAYALQSPKYATENQVNYIADLMQEFQDAVEEIVLPFLDRLLEREIDALSEEVRQSVKLDSIRWAELENRYQYYEEYDNDIRYLKYFIEKRRDFLNEVWIQGEVYHSVTFEIDGEAWKKVYVKDGETPGQEPIPSRYGSLFMGWLSEEHDVPFDEYKPIYEDITFYAIWQELPCEEVVITSGAKEGAGEN